MGDEESSPEEIQQNYTITVEVEEPGGASVSGAEVKIEGTDYKAQTLYDTGTYIFDEVELEVNEQYTIIADKENYAADEIEFTTYAEETSMSLEDELMLEYRDLFDVSGRIIAENDSPMANVEVTFSEGYDSVFTDEEGYWEKTDIKEGVKIRPVKENYSFREVTVEKAQDNINFVGVELEEGQEDIVYTEDARVMTENEVDEIEKISEERDEILFEEEAEFVEDVEEENVLMAERELPGAEHGFLKEVTAVNGREVRVEPATLDDYIKEGEISAGDSITFEEMAEQIKEQEDVYIQTMDAQKERFTFMVEFEDVDNVYLEGHLEVTTDTEVGLDLEYTPVADLPQSLNKFEFVVEPGFETEIDVVAEKGIELEREKEIGSFSFQIPVYKALDLDIQIALLAGAKGEVGTELKSGLNFARDYELGVIYEDEEFEMVSDQHGEGFSVDKPTWSGFAEAKAYTGLELRGGPRVAYTVTPGLGGDLKPNVGMEGNIQTAFDNWKWEYDMEMLIESEFFASLEVDLRITDLETKWEGPSTVFYRTNIGYGVSGRVETEEGEGLDDVEVAIEGEEWVGDGPSITDDEGFWTRHLLRGEVEVIPEHEDYNFEPESRTISGSNSDSDFVAYPEDEPGDPVESYTLDITEVGEGTVNLDPDQAEYEEGTEVDLEAIPDDGWAFSHWDGDVSEPASAETTIIMDEDKALAAHFEEDEEPAEEYTLTINTEGEGTVDIEPDEEKYEEGTEVELEAIPDDGWEFDEWSGDIEETEEEITVTMDNDKNITAHFGAHFGEEYNLEIFKHGEGEIIVDPEQDKYSKGKEVNVEAIPADGWSFEGWTGKKESSSEEIEILIQDDSVLIASFVYEELVVPPYEDFYFVDNEIMEYQGDEPSIFIPEELVSSIWGEEEKVEIIGDGSFGWGFHDDSIEKVNIPDTVTTIGRNAFLGASHTGVTHVSWGQGVEEIEKEAFSNHGLTEIKLPDSVKSIGENAFDPNRNTMIEIIKIPGNVELASNSFDFNFKETYLEHNQEGGIYVFDEEKFKWEKVQ